MKMFVVTITSNKGYNKWYMCEKGNHNWKKGMEEGKFSFEARIIQYDHRLGRYEYLNPVDLKWGPESIVLLADGSDIKEDKGRVSFVLA